MGRKARQSPLTIEDRIILHLSNYRSWKGKIAVPKAITQYGIADAVGVERPHVAVELKRMKEKGLIEEFKAHAGGVKRRKVYFITIIAQKRLEEIENSVKNKRVILEIDGCARSMKSDEALVYVSRYAPYWMAVDLVLKLDEIGLPDIKKRMEEKRKTARSSPFPVVSELFGRQKEIGSIKKGYKKNKTPIFIIGPPGIGKSSLAASFVSNLRSPIFWHRIEKGESSERFLRDLLKFLIKNGPPNAVEMMCRKKVNLEMLIKILQDTHGRQVWVFDDYQNSSKDVKNAITTLQTAVRKTPVKMIIISREMPEFHTKMSLTVEDAPVIFLGGIPEDAAKEMLISKNLFANDENFREIYAFSKGHPLILKMAAMAWSKMRKKSPYLSENFYDSLTENEKRLLSSLTVYRRPVTLDAFIETEKDAHTLRSLVGKGIVHYDTDERYFTHEIIKSLFKKKRDQRTEHLRAFEYCSVIWGVEEKIEAVYHLLMAERYDLMEEYLFEVLNEIISQGMADDILAFLKDADIKSPVILASMGLALEATGKLDEAADVLTKAIDIYEKERDMETPSYIDIPIAEKRKEIERKELGEGCQ